MVSENVRAYLGDIHIEGEGSGRRMRPVVVMRGVETSRISGAVVTTAKEFAGVHVPVH
jgi:hypothetical protein